MRRSLFLLVVVLVAACGADATTGATDTAPAALRSTWVAVAEAPIGPRVQATIAWNGSEILVFGGSAHLCPPGAGCGPPDDPPFTDGAAYDPQRNTWRSIADAPIPVPFATTASLDGDVYAIVTHSAGPGADQATTLLRYRSDTDEWTSHDVPVDVPVQGLVATGSGIVVYPGSDESGDVPDLEFNPTDASWSELPADPLSPSFARHLVSTGDTLHLFAKDLTPSPGGASGPALVTAARLEHDGWVELPTGDTLGFWPVIVDGDRLVAPQLGCADGGQTNGYGRCIPGGAVFDTATASWSELPAGPRHGERHALSSGAVTADEVLLTGIGHPVLDLTTDTWFEGPELDEQTDDGTFVQRSFAGVGPHGFVFGGSRFGPSEPGGVLLGDAWLWSP